MDSTLDVDALAARLESRAELVAGAVDLLFGQGLLEEGEGTPELAGAPVMRALARLGATTMVNRHPGEAWDRLATTTVALHGREAVVGKLGAALEAAGVGRVLTNDEAAHIDLPGDAGGCRRSRR